jgi:4-amino-4-deoxy-L-arabinose transferase-like glycosyltransferase
MASHAAEPPAAARAAAVGSGVVAVRALAALVAVLFAIRLISLGLYPLGDTTEARYGEVARLMLASGDWITPQNDPGVPFWAKPPLSFWAQAGTMAIFGVNEFGARLSSLLFALAIGFVLFRLARGEPQRPAAEAWWAVLLLASMPVYFAMAGAVMTDMALALCTTAAMACFWRAFAHGSRRAGYGFFAALGFGLLAKGPVMLVLVGTATLLFVAIERPCRATLLRCWQSLPMLSGTALMLAIAVPWYLIAEHATPGFLNYFIVGEHFLRFIEPAWAGDLYGNAHHEPRGMIWLFFLAAALMPLLLVPWLVFAARARASAARAPAATFDKFLFAWALAVPVFFTVSSNVIWTYALPSAAPIALLVARHLAAPERAANQRAALLLSGLFATGCFIAALLVAPGKDFANRTSTRELVRAAEQITAGRNVDRLSYFQHEHSTKFYSAAGFRRIVFNDVQPLLASGREFVVMVKTYDLDNIPELRAQLNAHTRRIDQFGDYVLFHRP